VANFPAAGGVGFAGDHDRVEAMVARFGSSILLFIARRACIRTLAHRWGAPGDAGRDPTPTVAANTPTPSPTPLQARRVPSGRRRRR